MGLIFSRVTPEYMNGAPDSEEEYVQWLLDNPSRMQDTDEHFKTRMMHAVDHSLYEVFRTIDAQHSSEVYRWWTNRQTCMHLAAIAGDSEMIRVIHARDPRQLHAQSEPFCATPIHVAAEHGHCQVIETLCELGSRIDGSMAFKYYAMRPIEIALINNQWDAALTLLRCGSEAIDGKFFKKGYFPEHKTSPITLRLRYVLTGIWPPSATASRPTDEEVRKARQQIFALDHQDSRTTSKL